MVLAQDAGGVVGVVEGDRVKLDELEQVVESREVADAVERLLDGSDGPRLLPLVQLAPDEVAVGVECAFERDQVGAPRPPVSLSSVTAGGRSCRGVDSAGSIGPEERR
jgi:hypothetical protein